MDCCFLIIPDTFFYTARIFKKKLYGLREAQEFLVQDSQVKQCQVAKYGRDNR
jgi:hypothetical protein